MKVWDEMVTQSKLAKLDQETLNRLFSCVDLTSLNETDTPASITQLCSKAYANDTHVAAICIYPQFIKLVRSLLKTMTIATVINFPAGDQALTVVLQEINQALGQGADELDVVFPYALYASGDEDAVIKFISACKEACEGRLLKVILETSRFNKVAQIAAASKLVFLAGADFVKTSTGKNLPGATLENVAVLLGVAKELQPTLNRPLGVKVSGGVKEPEEAAQYLKLADLIWGKEQVTPTTFRIGASNLINAIALAILSHL